MTQNISRQKGIAQFLVIAIMAFMALGIPTATKLVQQNQENRSKAAEELKPVAKIKEELRPVAKIKYDFNLDGKLGEEDVRIISEYIVSLPKNPYDLNNDGQVDILDVANMVDIVKKGNGNKEYDFNLNGKLGEEDVRIISEYIVSLPKDPYDLNNDGQVDITDTVKLIDIINSNNYTTNKLSPTARPIGSTDVSLFHNFAPKDDAIRKLGSVLVNDILIKTGDRKVDTATIVYCYTNLLKPDFNSISSEQIASVISNKEIGNNCAEVKVTFNDKEINDSFPPYKDLKGYIISYKATVINYGKGTLGINCAKSSLINKEGQNILVNDPNCGYSNGTEFTLTDPQKVSPTPTRVPIRKPTPNPQPISGIKVSPTSLRLKVGQSQNLTYILTPSMATDTVTVSTSVEGVVKIKKITTKCSDNPNTKCIDAPGINHLQVTALKTGTVKVKLITSSGKTAEAIVIVTGEIVTTPPPKVPGAYLYFSPQKQNHKVGDVFKITIGVDSNLHIIGGVDAVGTFDSSKLDLLSINKSPSMVFGNEGNCEISKDIVPGKFALSCFDQDSLQSKSIKGELVYLTFKAKSSGLAKIEFTCEQNSLVDSNIVTSNPAQDIIVCGKNINSNISITESSQTKIDGKCGTTLNQCLKGIFKNLPDTTSHLIWQCLGSNGGKSVKCSKKNNLTTPTPNANGVCGDTTKIVTNTCVSGSPVEVPDTTTEYIWDCKGTKTTQRCVKVKGSDDSLCPQNQFNHWGKCENDLEIGWGCDRDGVCISGKCDLSTNRCVN